MSARTNDPAPHGSPAPAEPNRAREQTRFSSGRSIITCALVFIVANVLLALLGVGGWAAYRHYVAKPKDVPAGGLRVMAIEASFSGTKLDREQVQGIWDEKYADREISWEGMLVETAPGPDMKIRARVIYLDGTVQGEAVVSLADGHDRWYYGAKDVLVHVTGRLERRASLGGGKVRYHIREGRIKKLK